MINKSILAAAALAFAASQAAVAAPAEDAINACRVAIQESTGEEAVARLTKIRPRGNNYEVWLNVDDSGSDLRTYCYLRRGEVEKFVVEDGSWKGRNPPRPETVDLS